jgi:hypothetical protein
MFAKSLIVSLALVAAAVQADLDISTPSELKQVSSPAFCRLAARRKPVPATAALCSSYQGLVVDCVITV